MTKCTTWGNKTFGRRIAVFFIPVMILLILVVTGVTSYINYTVLFQIEKQNIESAIRRGISTADLYFQDIKTSAVLVAQNDDLIYMLTNYQNMTLQERFYQQEKIDEALRNTSFMRDHLLDCVVVGLNGYRTNMPDRKPLKEGVDLLREEWMQPFTESDESGFGYTGVHQADYYYGQDAERGNVISVVFPIRPYGKRIGYMIIDLDFEQINNIMIDEENADALNFIVADRTGNIVFTDDQTEVNTVLPEAIIERFGAAEPFFIPYRGQLMFCSSRQSETTNWQFVGMIPKAELMRPIMQIIRTLLFVILPTALVTAVVLSLVIAQRIKKPLNDIVEQLESLDIDNPKPVCVRNSVGEIEYLAEKITEMSGRIIRLINQVYKAEIKRKDAQIEALISQINPHFLYNTLQLIKTEAVCGNSREVSGTVNCLSRFLRYTIDNRSHWVTLAEEIEHIRSYMEIYKKRFPEKYVLDIDVAETLRDIMIPKLTLQPLVENALKHGLREKDGRGIIRLTAINDEDLVILIEDNGIGMEQAQIPRLMDRICAKNSRNEHVGLRNIHERLRLSEGDGYGIVKIESEPGHGFRIWLRIKKGRTHV